MALPQHCHGASCPQYPLSSFCSGSTVALSNLLKLVGIRYTSCFVADNRIPHPKQSRLMIDWLFSQPEAQRHLATMTTKINDAIKRQRKEAADGREMPDKICVGVVCENGTHLSPCFVERLYELYHYEPPCGRVSVMREHRDILKGEWGRHKDFVWQRTHLPHKLIDLRDALQNEMWVNFPRETNTRLEKAFQMNPFSNGVEVEGSVVDFEGATMYNRTKRKEFWIRCTMVSHSGVLGWSLGHDAYMSTAKSYHAAGILPYSVHPKTGEAVFLIGRITYAFENWCDFGGLKHIWYVFSNL